MRLAGEGPGFAEVRVGDVMTRSPVTLAPDDDVLDAARLMGERKVRHLPVLEGENLLGMLGVREVMRTLVERLWRGAGSRGPRARPRAARPQQLDAILRRVGRVAQRESARFTRGRSLVRSQARP